MARNDQRSAAMTQGHVAVYARDARWLRSVGRSLEKAGHSCQQMPDQDALQGLLMRQRFDVLVLKVRDELDARKIARVLENVTPPHHVILVGSASALPLTLKARRAGTFRYVPGQITAREIACLVDASISAGVWEEFLVENGDVSHLQEVDLQETIERAAATVYTQANRKRQRFNTAVTGPATHVLGNAAKLRRTFAALLKLIVSLAPQGAAISVEARAGQEDWAIHIRASGKGAGLRPADLAEELQEERRTLTAISRSVREQGGVLWVELVGPAALALCLTLPLPTRALQRVS